MLERFRISQFRDLVNVKKGWKWVDTYSSVVDFVDEKFAPVVNAGKPAGILRMLGQCASSESRESRCDDLATMAKVLRKFLTRCLICSRVASDHKTQ